MSTRRRLALPSNDDVSSGDEARSGVAAVDRALAILNAFQHDDGPLTLHVLAERTGLYKSTILRLLDSLVRARCVQRLDDGRYQPGSTLLHWGSVYQASLRLSDHVLPILQRLVRTTSEGASFFVRDGDVRICLFRVDSPRSIRDHVRVGDVLPLDRGAAGRILLRTGRAPRGGAPPEMGRLIITLGEREPDIAAVAAPVFDADGSIRGALAVSGPISRFSPQAIAAIRQDVLTAARELTMRFGGDASLVADDPRMPVPPVAVD